MTKLSILSILVSIALTVAQNSYAEFTVSGLPREAMIRIDITRICDVNLFTAGLPFENPIKPTIQVGVYRGAVDPKTEDQSLISHRLEVAPRAPFEELATEVKSGVNGSKDYEFDDFSISVPVYDIETALVDLPIPRASNLVDRLIDQATDDGKIKEIQTKGIYIHFGNLTSLVAFNGKNSRSSTDLTLPYDDDDRLFDKVYPKSAVLLNKSRAFVSDASGHLTYGSNPDCSTHSFIKYTVSIVEEEDSAPKRSLQNHHMNRPVKQRATLN